MLPTDLIRDPASPDDAPVRARLARAYLEHKAELGLPVEDDAEIVRRVDEITALLWDRMALRKDNAFWLRRYGWFVEVVDELPGQRPAKRLDG